jgi:hypothetical protein
MPPVTADGGWTERRAAKLFYSEARCKAPKCVRSSTTPTLLEEKLSPLKERCFRKLELSNYKNDQQKSL